MIPKPNKQSCRSAWLLSVALVLLGGCKDDINKAVADPLDDPWVDAIDASSEDPTALPSAELNPADPVVEVGSLPAAQATAGVLAAPAMNEDGNEDGNEDEPAASDGSAAPGDAATPKTTAPAQPTIETPAGDEPAQALEPAPVAEPTPAPSAEPAKPAAPPPITSADFHGNYRFVGGSSQRADLDAAIGTTVNALAGLIRGLARKRLTATNPVDNTLDIIVAGDKVTTTFESGFNASCIVDGGTVGSTDIEGGKLAVRLRWKNGKLVQHMEGKGGARTIVYVLSADRKQLTIHHRITSDRLPVPLTYRLSYSRK